MSETITPTLTAPTHNHLRQRQFKSYWYFTAIFVYPESICFVNIYHNLGYVYVPYYTVAYFPTSLCSILCTWQSPPSNKFYLLFYCFRPFLQFGGCFVIIAFSLAHSLFSVEQVFFDLNSCKEPRRNNKLHSSSVW